MLTSWTSENESFLDSWLAELLVIFSEGLVILFSMSRRPLLCLRRGEFGVELLEVFGIVDLFGKFERVCVDQWCEGRV